LEYKLTNKNQNVVKESVGTIIGDKNKQTVIQTPKSNGSFNISAQDYSDKFVLIGRWLKNKLGLKNFYLLISILLIISLLIFIVYLLKVLEFSKLANLPGDTVLILIISGIISSIFGNSIRLSKSRKCENCTEYFAYRNHKPLKHITQGKYRGTTYHNLKQFLKCDFCGHELEHEYIDEE